MRSDLDNILSERDAEACLMFSDSFKEANMYYLTKFLAPDPFILLKKVDCDPILVISSMECSRAKKESIVNDVRSYEDYNLSEILKSSSEPHLGFMKFISTVAKKELGISTKIYVPWKFPAMVADALRHENLNIMPLWDVIEKARETKEPEELEEIVRAQAAVEIAVRKAIDVVKDAEVDEKGTLLYRVDGKREHLTVRNIKSILSHELLDRGFASEEMIVACGPKGADPHYLGNPEDKIKADQPIILDIYPTNIQKRYFTDMTRTIVKGKASSEIRQMFETVLEARNVSIDELKAGVTGQEVYDECCNVMEKAGYATSRGGRQITRGFIHSLGHGVGLQVHEGPALGEFSKLALEAHNVVTVEPGLYDPDVGGVRIEDIVEITKAGCTNLTKMKIQLEI